MSSLLNFMTIFYAIMLFVGGGIGYIKAHSKLSLITGSISCLFVLLALKIQEKNPKSGFLFLASISLVLSVFFLKRFLKAYAFMPGGLMFILSLLIFVVVIKEIGNLSRK